MKERLAKLIDLKSIATLLLTLVFCYLAVIGKIESQEFLTVYTVIISFYYGVQYQKNTTK